LLLAGGMVLAAVAIESAGGWRRAKGAEPLACLAAFAQQSVPPAGEFNDNARGERKKSRRATASTALRPLGGGVIGPARGYRHASLNWRSRLLAAGGPSPLLAKLVIELQTAGGRAGCRSAASARKRGGFLCCARSVLCVAARHIGVRIISSC